MRSRVMLLVALLVLLAGHAFGADGKETPKAAFDRVLTTVIDGWIVIDPQGHVADFGIDTKANDALRASLDRTARRWTFHPVKVNGVASAVKTAVRITLVARQDGDQYRVNVDNVVFPANKGVSPDAEEQVQVSIKARRMAPPQYPRAQQMGGMSANVLLAIRFGLNGEAEEVAVVQSTLIQHDASDSAAQKALREFERSSLVAAKRWAVELTVSGGTPTARDLTAYVPVSYRMWGQELDADRGLWRQEIRGERRPVSWVPEIDGSQQVGASDLRQGEMFPVATRFRFVEDVRGQSLM